MLPPLLTRLLLPGAIRAGQHVPDLTPSLMLPPKLTRPCSLTHQAQLKSSGHDKACARAQVTRICCLHALAAAGQACAHTRRPSCSTRRRRRRAPRPHRFRFSRTTSMLRTFPRPPGPVGGATASLCSAPTPHQDTSTGLQSRRQRLCRKPSLCRGDGACEQGSQGRVCVSRLSSMHAGGGGRHPARGQAACLGGGRGGRRGAGDALRQRCRRQRRRQERRHIAAPLRRRRACRTYPGAHSASTHCHRASRKVTRASEM